jgi:ATP-binding cassette subfamily C protein CydD/ATP-binding cassette subfamily C protein CydCD
VRDPRRRAEPSATRRLRALPDVRRLSLWCAVAAVPVAVLLVVQWALVAHVVTTVFDGRSPADAASALTGALVAWGGRSVLLALRDGHASRVSARVRADLRRQLV